jgi:hypothetical protein
VAKARYESSLRGVHYGRGKGCKTATPELEYLVFDMREIWWSVGGYWGDEDESSDVADLFKIRGIKCTVLQPFEFGSDSE